MEQGHLSMQTHAEDKLKFCRALVLYTVSSATAPSSSEAASSYAFAGGKKFHKPVGEYIATARPSTEVCELFNKVMCHNRGGPSRPRAFPPLLIRHMSKPCRDWSPLPTVQVLRIVQQYDETMKNEG